MALYTHGPGIDDPLVMRYDGDDYFYHKNHLGSITEITNIYQATVKTYDYDAFGKILSETGSLAHNAFTYTGREYHENSGLYYYRARFYDPTMGRFITQDPIGILGGVNLYAYVGNRPVDLVDPLGLQEFFANLPHEIANEYAEAFEGTANDAINYIIKNAIVPGPYGSPNPEDWGKWVFLPDEAGKYGECWEKATWAAIWTATAADLTALGLIGVEYLGIEVNVLSEGNIFKIISKKLKRGFRIDPPHHGKPGGHMKYWKWRK